MTQTEQALSTLRRWGKLRKMVAELLDENAAAVHAASGDMAGIRGVIESPSRKLLDALSGAEGHARDAAQDAADALVAEDT